MVSILKHSSKSSNTDGKTVTMRNVVIAAGLALVLGLGWGFGIAASSHKISVLACVFQALFSLFVSSQGLLILIFHGVRSKDAKAVWRSWFRNHRTLYSVATNTLRDGGVVQRSGLATTSQSTHSTDEPSISLDKTSGYPTATEELIAIDASFGKKSSCRYSGKRTTSDSQEILVVINH